METHRVIPDVLPQLPNETLKVQYPYGEAKMGNVLKSDQLIYTPKVKWFPEPNYFYTLLMVDPDVPSRSYPWLGQYVHWFVGNIPGNKIDEGEVIVPYKGTRPGKRTGLHRYVFVVYRQHQKLVFNERRLDTKAAKYHRCWFKTMNLVDKYGLGHPHAGNFLRAQFQTLSDKENSESTKKVRNKCVIL